jgi:transposase
MCPPAIRSSVIPTKGTVPMIVLGADPHKQAHTVGAIDAATGHAIDDRTVRAKRRSFEDLLIWARGLDGERVWAIEDCRHVSGALERFLPKRGERVVRVAPRLVAGARRSARARAKSDAIDAVAIARAALREGLDASPLARPAGPEPDSESITASGSWRSAPG